MDVLGAGRVRCLPRDEIPRVVSAGDRAVAWSSGWWEVGESTPRDTQPGTDTSRVCPVRGLHGATGHGHCWALGCF